MSDLKTVIEGLDLCLEGLCDICSYKNSNAPGGCKDELMCDALALLREYAEMEKRFSQVLMETTGNLLNKTTYTVPAIIDCIREHYCDRCDVQEERDGLLKAQEPIEMRLHLCESCTKRYPDCNSDYIEFGCGFGNDNVIGCDAYTNRWVVDHDCQRDYEAATEMTEYCERYEPTYNPEDGSL